MFKTQKDCTLVSVPTYITMQGLVKEVTLKNHSNSGLAILHENKF